MTKNKHNMIMLLPTLLIRVPILGPLIVIAWVGEQADKLAWFLSDKLPGLRRN